MQYSSAIGEAHRPRRNGPSYSGSMCPWGGYGPGSIPGGPTRARFAPLRQWYNGLMKKVILSRAFLFGFLGFVAFVAGLWFLTSSTDAPQEPWPTQSAYLHQFEDYATSATFVGTPATPDFSTNSKAERYRTVITEAAAAGPNFAGTYIVAEWECGSACQGAAIVDARSGTIYEYGIIGAYGFRYLVDSALFVVNPSDAIASSSAPLPANVTTDYYLFKDGRLTMLARQDASTGETIACAQVLVTAVNPLSGEIRDFGSPCEVPYGWEPRAVTGSDEEPPVSGGAPVGTSPCYVGGCSSQVCSDTPGMASTCEWRDSYQCFRDATCERQQDGRCGWTMDEELSACLAENA
jgi:hypothetical protein